MSDIAVARLDRDAVNTYRGELARLHQAAFGNSDAYMEAYRDVELPEMASFAGFRCFAAHDQERMIGFVLGYEATADPVWYRNVAEGVRATPIASWLGRAWYFGDIAVHPEAQGRGAGSVLHDRIVATVPVRDLVLITYHGDHPARRFYLRHGWRVLMPDFIYSPGAPPTTLMGQ
jgi:GNAT superfamily N-acetyltransferase